MRRQFTAMLFIGWLVFSQACAGNMETQASPSTQDKGNLSKHSALIADHASVTGFDSIPDAAINDASGVTILFKHASTGGRINQLGLDTLQGTTENDTAYPLDKYDRRNWVWQEWRYDGLSRGRNLIEKVIDKITGENAMSRIKMREFTTDVSKDHQTYDVIGMKFCYLDWKGLDWKFYRDMMLKLEASYPDTQFVWATAALQYTWDAPESPAGAYRSLSSFNSNIREYAGSNNKPLYDIADIESHRADGSQCVDALGREVFCPEYHADELGHPNLEGSVRLAKGFWWLVASMGEKNITNKSRE